MGQVLSSGWVCLQPSSNNVAEYIVVIELLHDSQLVFSHINGLYRIRDPTLLRRFLHIRFLEQQFENITYIHVPRIFNQVFDSYANYVLD